MNDGSKKSKVLETSEIYNRNNGAATVKMDNIVFIPENHVEKKMDNKTEQPITANGKNPATQVS